MWPWGHLAVGVFLFLAVSYWRGYTWATIPALGALGIGTQFPDLVDKPLAWTFAILPSGRSLAHSLITASLVILVVAAVAAKYDSLKLAVAFAVGYISHIFADLGPTVIWGLLHGHWEQLQWATYLLWPLLPSPPYPNDESLLSHLQAISLTAYMLFQIGLAVAASLLVAYRLGAQVERPS